VKLESKLGEPEPRNGRREVAPDFDSRFGGIEATARKLSLAIRPWVSTSKSESWDVGLNNDRHIAWCISPVSVVSQCKLLSNWCGRKHRSATRYGHYGSERTLHVYL